MMAKFVKSAAGRGRHRVEALALETKDSTLIWFLGGERPHVGAVAVAQSRSSLKDPSKKSCNVSLVSLLGHKEELLAYELAESFSKALEKDVVVAVGMHIDDAVDRDIDLLVRNCKRAGERLLKEISKALTKGR